MSQNGTTGEEPEPMRYATLGEDPLNDAERLEKYSGVIGWDYIKPHFDRGALLYVDGALDINEVGAAIVADDKSRVANWLKSGDLLRPGEQHAAHWSAAGSQFSVVVVSPFVLVQPADTDG